MAWDLACNWLKEVYLLHRDTVSKGKTCYYRPSIKYWILLECKIFWKYHFCVSEVPESVSDSTNIRKSLEVYSSTELAYVGFCPITLALTVKQQYYSRSGTCPKIASVHDRRQPDLAIQNLRGIGMNRDALTPAHTLLYHWQDWHSVLLFPCLDPFTFITCSLLFK